MNENDSQVNHSRRKIDRESVIREISASLATLTEDQLQDINNTIDIIKENYDSIVDHAFMS